MATAGPPTTFDDPAWYEPLKGPAWFLAPAREGAPRVVVRPDPQGPPDDELGPALFVGEAIRFSTDARVAVQTGGERVASDAAALVEVGPVTTGPGRSLHVTVRDAQGERLGEQRASADDDDALGAALAGLPSGLTGMLAPLGVRAVWSTAFHVPADARAVDAVRALGALARLRALGGAPEAGDRGVGPAADAELHVMSHAVASHPSPTVVAAFIAGLVVARGLAGSGWGSFRLQSNALAQRATDPRDPVFRLSVVSLRLFGDTGEASARAARLMPDGDRELRAWLARIGAVG